jgi:hypothetical protein
MRPPLVLRAGSYAVAGALVALVAVLAERLVA